MLDCEVLVEGYDIAFWVFDIDEEAHTWQLEWFTKHCAASNLDLLNGFSNVIDENRQLDAIGRARSSGKSRR